MQAIHIAGLTWHVYNVFRIMPCSSLWSFLCVIALQKHANVSGHKNLSDRKSFFRKQGGVMDNNHCQCMCVVLVTNEIGNGEERLTWRLWPRRSFRPAVVQERLWRRGCQHHTGCNLHREADVEQDAPWHVTHLRTTTAQTQRGLFLPLALRRQKTSKSKINCLTGLWLFWLRF